MGTPGHRKVFAAVAAVALAGCAASSPPSADELATFQNAPAPSSPAAAQAAIRAYFGKAMFDPDSAEYRFLGEPVRGHVFTLGSREFGYFACGQYNAKNRMGGYVGYKLYLAHFDPAIRDKVADGMIAAGDDEATVKKVCTELYGRDLTN